ncbi:PEP-CTERM sorting domain-containing protein [Eleftheria terrae]|uniref:PEP-CTERM sorting domain-containing protein n=1 Tax=Eleftheria terrae TaxID=1597781 RepID=UPI00263B606B|nr:PEP-CTERM sorting domain-containing protein [Eleftheria terrae]WKB53034.1 PEP-CTERM sorting domain-containing protein [Eleftheria terrae]
MRYTLGLALVLALPAQAGVLNHSSTAVADFGLGEAVGRMTGTTTSDESIYNYNPEWGAHSGPWRVYAPDGSYRESRAFAAPIGFFAYSTDFNSKFESVLSMDKGFASVLIEPWWNIIPSAMPIRFSNGSITGSLFLEDTTTGTKIDVTAGGVFQLTGAPKTLRLTGTITGTPGRGMVPGTPNCGSFDCMVPAADERMAFRIGFHGLPILPAVPEPETYALMLAGLGLLAAVRRKVKAA